MRQLSTLILSLLICATCLAQPDSRPGPYQATLAKINALLIGGAATVKEIEFTTDGSALASSSKTQVYSDGNAGNVTANVPTGKAIKLAVAGTQVAQVDSTGLTLVKNLYYNGAGSASSTYTTEWADAANGNKFANVPTGKYEQHRVGGQSILKLGNNGNGTAANYWEIGDSTGPSSYVRGSGVDMVHYAATNYYESTTHRFCNSSAVESARITSIVGFLEAGKISLGGTIGSSADPGAGGLALTGKFYLSTTQTPASAGAAGTVGQVCWDSSYIYICTAANTWKRAAIATW